MKMTSTYSISKKEEKNILSKNKKEGRKISSKTKRENQKALEIMSEIASIQEQNNEKTRTYKEPNKTEEETIINVLYWKEIISIYTTNIELQKNLRKILGAPFKEDKRGRSIVASRWDIPMKDKQKISQILLKANILGL